MKKNETCKAERSIKELERLRKKVNAVDDEIVGLLGKRQLIVKLIGEIKKRNGIEILSATREQQILKRIRLKGEKNNFDLEFIDRIYRVIFKNSRKVQRLV
jgi:chorismate mutase